MWGCPHNSLPQTERTTKEEHAKLKDKTKKSHHDACLCSAPVQRRVRTFSLGSSFQISMQIRPRKKRKEATAVAVFGVDCSACAHVWSSFSGSGSHVVEINETMSLCKKRGTFIHSLNSSHNEATLRILTRPGGRIVHEGFNLNWECRCSS